MANSGEEDLLYYVIASNSVSETCCYPDSGKLGAGDHFWRPVQVDYYDGEE